MFLNLSRPISVSICWIVLERYTVSLLASGRSFPLLSVTPVSGRGVPTGINSSSFSLLFQHSNLVNILSWYMPQIIPQHWGWIPSRLTELNLFSVHLINRNKFIVCETLHQNTGLLSLSKAMLAVSYSVSKWLLQTVPQQPELYCTV